MGEATVRRFLVFLMIFILIYTITETLRFKIINQFETVEQFERRRNSFGGSSSMAALPWTLDRLITKVQDDLDLHAEDFVTPEELEQYVEDAITDAEEIVIDCFADTLLTFEDLTVTAGQEIIPFPSDIYETRIRGFYHAPYGFSSENPQGVYKLRQIPISEAGQQTPNEYHRYRIINSTADGPQIYVYPPITEASTDKFRVWYIRQFKRPTSMSDTLDPMLRPQYILAHVKCSAMKKEGDAMLDVEAANLLKQEDKIKRSISRPTDDDEGVLLEPDDYALSEAYGDDY